MNAAPTSPWAAKASTLYDPAYARRYRAHDDEFELSEPCRRFAEWLRQVCLQFTPPIDVLDLGCGTGRYFWALTGVRSLVGIDASPAMLAEARHPFNADRITAETVTLVEGDLFAHDFQPGQFDLAYSIGVLAEHAPFDAGVVAHVLRWLKPGGRFAFTTVHPDSPSIPGTFKRRVGRAIARVAPAVMAEPIRSRLLAGGLYADEQRVTELLRGSFEIEALRRFESEAHLHCWCVARKQPALAVPAGQRPLRVLQIVTWLGVGGAERLVLMAATGLPRTTFESAVCCFIERGDFADDAERQGVKVWCLNEFPSLRHPLALYRLYRIIRTFRPDIVHTHLQAPNLYGRLVALVAGVPIVVASEHNVYTTKARRHVLIERLLARRTDALVAVSEQVRLFLSAQLGLSPSTIQVVRNGIAPPQASAERVEALRRQLDLPLGRLVLGTVASLTPKKGHGYLLQALAVLRKRGVLCSLLLAGEGVERSPLEALAASLGVADQVYFLGLQRHVGDFLSMIDVFVLPSIVEGSPLALLEAMAAGKPVVATAVGGVPEVITSEVNGILVAPQTVQPLADAIDTLVSDAELRAEYGRRGRETVMAGFTEKQHLETLASLYLALARRSGDATQVERG